MSKLLQFKKPVATQLALFKEDKANTIGIGSNDLIVREYRGERVVTFDVVEKLHNKKDGVVRANFSENKKHFIEGVDYYVFKGKNGREALQTGNYSNLLELPKSNNFAFYLFTQTGYLMLVKSLSGDLAWAIQRELILNYFNRKEDANMFTIMRRMVDALEHSQMIAQETAEKLNTTNGKLDAANEKIQELDQRTSITIHPTWKQAHHIARDLGILSLANIAHSSVISAIAKQLKFKCNSRSWCEDDHIAVVAKLEGEVTAWEVYYKPAGIQSIMNWWAVNHEKAYFEELYKNKTKNHVPGDVRVSGYKIGGVKYIVKK